MVAACLLAPYGILDVLNRSPSAAVSRTLWILVLLGAAAAQDDGHRQWADRAARLVGVVSGIAATIVVSSSGGSRGLNFGFLYAVPFCALVLVPDLPSCAALAGLAATLGGTVLLVRDQQSLGAVAQWIARSASLGGVAAWGTVLYGQLINKELLAQRGRADALAALHQSEEKFRAAFSSSALGAVIVSIEGVITAANRAACEMLGAKDLEGRSYFDLLDAADVAAARSTFERLRSGRGAARVSRRFWKPCGEQVLASVHVAPLHDGTGRVHSVIALVEDVTERQALREQLSSSEALFRDLAERAAVGVYVIQDGVFQYVNPRFAEIFGYDRGELVGALDCDALTHPDDREVVREALRKRLALEVQSLQYEFHGLRKNGDVLDVAVFGTRTTYRSRAAIIGTLLDMTESKKAEEERIRIQKLESLGVLAGGIAHDFNNLLAAVMGDLSVARQHARGDPQLREVLDEAELATVRARALTSQLLTFSRGGEPVKKQVDLATLLPASASLAVRGSRSKCEYDLPPGLWPVLADEGQVGQVVHNLVLNAVQAMREGGVVGVRAENLGPDRARLMGLSAQPHVRVAVSDTGTGVPREIADRIFDPYFTTKKSGSGLGLATAHSIVVRHGGQIGVETAARDGATFYFALPATFGDAETAPPARTAQETGTGRILVMDDDDLVRRAATRMLGKLGYEALAAADGEEALAVCERERAAGRPIRAVLMDLTIPNGMGGAQAVRLLKQRAPEVKAIVSSGYSSDPIMAGYEQQGFSGVLAKPYSIDQLREVLGAVLGPRSIREVA